MIAARQVRSEDATHANVCGQRLVRIRAKSGRMSEYICLYNESTKEIKPSKQRLRRQAKTRVRQENEQKTLD
jgi:hypothetical protein